MRLQIINDIAELGNKHFSANARLSLEQREAFTAFRDELAERVNKAFAFESAITETKGSMAGAKVTTLLDPVVTATGKQKED